MTANVHSRSEGQRDDDGLSHCATIEPRDSNWTTPEKVVAALIGITLIALRTAFLSRESFWLDELATLDVLTEPVARIPAVLARWDNHPPLYFVLARGWAVLFSRSEAALRSMNCAIDATTALLLFRFAVQMGSRRAGLVAAGIFAATPLCVRLAREARMYPLLAMTTVAATLAFLNLAASVPPPRDTNAESRPRYGAAALYALALASMLYTHVYAVFVAGAHLATLVVLAVLRSWTGRRAVSAAAGLKWACLALAAALLAFVPWLPTLVARTRIVDRGFWLTHPRWSWPLEWGGGSGVISWAFVLVLVGSGVRGLRWLNAKRSEAALAIALTLVGLTLVPMGVGLVFRPIFFAKYAIGTVVLVALLAGFAFAALAERHGARSASIVAVVMVALGVAASVATVFRARLHEDFRSASRFATLACERDGVRSYALRYARMYRHYVPARCEVRDASAFARPNAGETLDALMRDLAASVRFIVLEVHSPAMTSQAQSRLRESFVRVSAVDWTDARASVWARTRIREAASAEPLQRRPRGL